MAEAYGQLTGRPGVCLSTLGPGATNLVNAVASAYLDRVPMIAISGQIETRREPTFTHQVVDHNRLFSSISKWTAAVQPHTVADDHAPRAAHRDGGAAGVRAPHHRRRRRGRRSDGCADRAAADGGCANAAGLLDCGADADPVRQLEGGAPARSAGGHFGRLERRGRGGRSAWPKRSAARSSLRRWPRASCPRRTRSTPARSTWRATASSGTSYAARTCCSRVGFDAVELIKPWPLAVPAIHIDTVRTPTRSYPAESKSSATSPGSSMRCRRLPQRREPLHAGRTRGAPRAAARTLLRRARGRASSTRATWSTRCARPCPPTRWSPPTSARTSCWSARAGPRTRRAAC